MELSDEGSRRNPWDAYWETLPDRQKLLVAHAREYVSRLEGFVGLPPAGAVLDFGCGFGLVAETLAPQVGSVVLWDASARMRQQSAERIADRPNARVCDRSELDPSPANPTYDLVLANSVIQYMGMDEFAGWLRQWRRLLAPAGRIVVSDVTADDHSASADLMDVLRFARRHGFLTQAIAEAAGDLPRYWRTRRARPLMVVHRRQLLGLGREAGLDTAYVPNLTALQSRTTAVYADRGAP